MTLIRLRARPERLHGDAWSGLAAAVAALFLLCGPPGAAHAQEFAQETNEVPIGTFELQGQGVAVDSSRSHATETSPAYDPDSARRWFLQRFELSLRESKDARQAMLDDAEGELKNGRTGAAQRLFERLIADAPETEEAKAARAHLADLYRPKKEPSSSGEALQDVMRNATRVSEAMDEEFLTLAGDRVFFGQGNAELGSRARAVIQAQARYLKAKPELAVIVEGHEDDAVSAEESKALGESRAEAVRAMLISEGVSGNRIMIVSKGRNERVAPCEESQCRAQNRRAVTVLMITAAGETRLKASKINELGADASQE